jgi:hypothetical protein
MLNLNKKYLLLICLIVVVAIAYWPSLFHVSRADHRIYLIETSDMETLPELLGKTYALNRTRQFDPGDSLLFRPLLYTFMALEMYFFQYNFGAWQLVGVILHCLVLISLWRLLNTIRPDNLSFFFVLFFSLLHIGQDAVIWHHINGYLVFLVFLLAAFRNLILFYRDSTKDVLFVRKATLFLTLACLFHEAAVVICLMLLLISIIKAFLEKENDLTGLKIFLIPAVVFFSLDILHLFLHTGSLTSSPGKIMVSVTMFLKAIYIVLISFVLPFVPDMLSMQESSRVFIPYLQATDILQKVSLGLNFSFMNGVIFIFFITFVFLVPLFVMIKTEKKRGEEKLSFLLVGSLALLFSFLYILLLFVAHPPEQGFPYLKKSLYHFYPLISMATTTSAIRSPALTPTMPAPRISSVDGSMISFVSPSVRFNVKARPEAAQGNFAILTSIF